MSPWLGTYPDRPIQESIQYVESFLSVDTVVCPPGSFVMEMRQQRRRFILIAQL